jgi:alpha-galactosidase
MKTRPLPFIAAALALTAGLAFAQAPAAGGGKKKLLVFLLAGQSNMQGHAEVSTLAYLPKPAHVPSEAEWAEMSSWLERDIRRKQGDAIRDELLKDPANAALPRKEFGELHQKAIMAVVAKARAEGYEEFKKRQTDPERAARDKELAAIFTPGLTDAKVLEAAVAAKSQKDAVTIADTWVEKTGIPTGKRTFVAAYGGVNRGATPGVAGGPLATGYGARPSAFGPEYALGVMLERALDQPILIIKTAWGGKSLHYDFRPPSAGPYQPTANERDQLERWKARKATWDQYLAGGGTAETMIQMEKDIKKLENEKRALQASLAKLPADEKAAAQEKINAMNTRGAELRKALVPPPGDMPKQDAAGFYWNEMIGFIRKVLADPKAWHPEYDPQAGYEVAGGVWFQGFNDQFDPEFHGNYAANMVHFIQDLRKEVKQPDMPFVIGVLGTPAFRAEALENNVAIAQRKAAAAPELAGTVAAVESWPLTTPEVALWRSKKDAARADGSPEDIKRTEEQWILHGSNLGYHYDGSGRFFIRLGDEFAQAIMKLRTKK